MLSFKTLLVLTAMTSFYLLSDVSKFCHNIVIALRCLEKTLMYWTMETMKGSNGDWYLNILCFENIVCFKFCRIGTHIQFLKQSYSYCRLKNLFYFQVSCRVYKVGSILWRHLSKGNLLSNCILRYSYNSLLKYMILSKFLWEVICNDRSK